MGGKLIKLIKALRSADGQTMLGKEEDLQRMMNRSNKTTKIWNKTKHQRDEGIRRVKGEEKNMKIAIDGEEIKQVTEFCYLRSLISDDAKCHREIKTGIAMGKECQKERS